MNISPYPRSRTYASPAIFGGIARDTLLGRAHRGDEDLERLEAAFGDMLGGQNALCLAQGRLGIYLALRELIEPGQGVILSPYTIYDVINMVLAAGGVPVFVDVDPLTGNLTPAAVQQAITPDTGAVLATHIHGLSCEIQAILDTCRAADVPLIEDCAQCLGAQIDGRPIGTFGDAAIFSFSRAKNVNTIYGGMLVASDPALMERMRAQSERFEYESLGRVLKRTASTVFLDVMTAPLVFQAAVFPLVRLDASRKTGYVDRMTGAESSIEKREDLPDSYRRRMSPMQARLALAQLPEVEPNRRKRVARAHQYQEGMADLDWLDLPPFSDDGRHTYLSYPVQTDDRDALRDHLFQNGRDVRLQYYHNLADVEAFKAFKAHCPTADRIASRTLLLPIYPSYPEREVRKTIEAIRAFQPPSRS